MDGVVATETPAAGRAEKRWQIFKQWVSLPGMDKTIVYANIKDGTDPGDLTRKNFTLDVAFSVEWDVTARLTLHCLGTRPMSIGKSMTWFNTKLS